MEVWFAAARTVPLTAMEISLMLRSGYSNEAVMGELSARHFSDTFDSTIEKQLLEAGANKSLIEVLRNGVYQASPGEVTTTKARTTAQTPTSGEASQYTKANGDLMKSDDAARRTNPPAAQQIGGTIYDHLKDDLVYWHNGSLVPFDNEALEKKKFYLLVFSAIWSKEGRQLTTQLSDYYNRVAPQHPEFEVVFFSADRSAFAMDNYISQTQMPWPAIAYDKLAGKAGALADRFTHKIPRLILADATGTVLSDSGEDHPDFEKVINDLNKILDRQ